jgi:anti-anti-sigma factor
MLPAQYGADISKCPPLQIVLFGSRRGCLPPSELGLAAAPSLERALRSAQLRAQLVVLDLRELTFADSCGVRVAVCAGLRARRAGRRLVLLRGASQIQRLLTLSGASDLAQTVDLAPLAAQISDT